MGRGGDDIRVTVVPNDKKDRLVIHSQVSRGKSSDETGNLRSFAIGGMLTAVVTSSPHDAIKKCDWTRWTRCVFLRGF